MSEKTKRKRCCNCRHTSEPFKIHSVTQYHCLHHTMTEKFKTEPNWSPWDTLMNFYDTCNLHEDKIK